MKFTLEDILNRVHVTGVIHVGGYVGEEFGSYKGHGIKHMLFFEPQRRMYELLIRRIAPLITDENIIVFNLALGNFNGKKEMYISYDSTDPLLPIPGSASSSLLTPKKHLTEHPTVKFPTKESVDVRRLDEIFKENKIDPKNFNMMNIDVQGYELEVLKGSVDTLDNIEFIMAEVNNDELYENCTLIDELDSFLSTFNFERKLLDWVCPMWGNAFYVKDSQ
jgi:FkbM family methyltransferase